jgi:hypothetical protein
MTEQPFILGVNYWPQDKAMFMWREFDRGGIGEDFSVISDLGLSCVGISLLWEDFQPHPRNVPPLMLDRLVHVLERADDNNLAVFPTLFTGHTGGLNWLPPWMLMTSTAEKQFQVFSKNRVRGNRPRNPYSDPEVMEAQIFFLRELLGAVSGHPALIGWNLGSEASLWAVPPDEFSANLWLQAMTETLKEKNDEVPVTLGLHVRDLLENLGPRLSLVAHHLDYVGIRVNLPHISWSEGPLDKAVLPFVARVIEWLAKKPVSVLDFGLPTIPTVQDSWSRMIRDQGGVSLFSEDDVAEFVDEALAHLRRSRMLGVYWQSFGDYHPSIWNWPPLDRNMPERFLGLLRHDGSPKPATAVFKPRPTETEEGRQESVDWIDVGEEEYYEDPAPHLSRLYRRFREYYSFG